MRHSSGPLQPIICAFVALLTFATSPHSVAQDLKRPAHQFEFDTGGEALSFAVPEGWKIVSDDSATKRPDASSEKQDMPRLLFYAIPDDPSRRTSLAVVNQLSASPASGPAALKSALQTLCEIAAQQGHIVTSTEVRGDASSLPNVIFVRLMAEREGLSRTFTMISFNRANSASIRCYWRSDLSDLDAPTDYNLWFGSLKLKGSSIAALLPGAPGLPPGQTPPVVAEKDPTPPPPAPVSSAASRSVSEKIQSIVSDYSGALVLIEGDHGTGSGFLCNYNGEPSLLTNAHVLADNLHPRFRTIDDRTIPMGPAFLAVDHDICRISAPSASAKLEVMTNVDKEARVGDRVAVLGNAEGSGVVMPLEGKIVGIGPNLIEVDAPFVPGNSGSPIIHLDSGKVIGIATYILMRKVEGENGISTKERRFGYRLDKVKEWQPVNWPLFYKQSAQVAQLKKTGEEFITLFTNANQDKSLYPADYTYSRIRNALENFQRRISSGNRPSRADAQAASRELFDSLRIATQIDIATFDSRSAYDYFRREVETEAKFRKELYDALTQALE